MKIYICGAHSSGKTTLARYISEKYNLPMISEVARTILSENEFHLDSLRANINLVNEYQSQIFYRQIREEQKKEHSFVSDRTFDCLAYAAQHSSIFYELMKTPEALDYLKSLNDPDNIIFFVRPSRSTLKDDGVRESLTWDGVIAIDAMVKMLLQLNNIRHFIINTDSMQERTQFVDSVLSLKGYAK